MPSQGATMVEVDRGPSPAWKTITRPACISLAEARLCSWRGGRWPARPAHTHEWSPNPLKVRILLLKSAEADTVDSQRRGVRTGTPRPFASRTPEPQSPGAPSAGRNGRGLQGGDAQEVAVRVFLADRLEWADLSSHEGGVQFGHALVQVRRAVPSHLLQLCRPGGQAQGVESEPNGGCRDLRRAPLGEVRVLQAELDEKMRERHDGPVARARADGRSRVAGKEGHRRDHGQDGALHLEDLVARVRVIGDIDEIFDSGRREILVLGCHEHTAHPDQLELAPHDRHVREEAVDVIHAQLVLLPHLHEPVDEDAPHAAVDVVLGREEVGHDAVAHLAGAQPSNPQRRRSASVAAPSCAAVRVAPPPDAAWQLPVASRACYSRRAGAGPTAYSRSRPERFRSGDPGASEAQASACRCRGPLIDPQFPTARRTSRRTAPSALTGGAGTKGADGKNKIGNNTTSSGPERGKRRRQRR
eukprot:scaffold6279_cov228-Isochrysis_galbana.AAC.9